MPSKLLDIIRKIDDSRLNLLNVFEMRKYPVNKHTTLSVLSNFAAQGLKDYNAVDPNENLIGGVQYYDNPEDDPEVWTEYKKWPDLYTAFKNSTTLTIDQYNVYVPYGAMLVRCDGVESINLRWSSNTVSSVANALNVYPHYQITSIKTGTYYQGSTNPIIPSDEFIIGEDGHMYFGCILYVSRKSSNANMSSNRYEASGNVEIKEIIFDPTVPQNTKTFTSTYTITIGESVKNTLEVLRYVWSPVPKEEWEWTGRTPDTYQYTPRANAPATNNLKLVQIDLPEFEEQKQNVTAAPLGVLRTSSFGTFNTLINNNKYIGTSLWIPHNARYIKTPSISTRVDWAPASKMSCGPWMCPLKYLEITNEEAHRDYSNRTNYLYPFQNASGTSGYGGECMFPRLRDTNLVKYCTEYKRISVFKGSFNHVKTASFEFEEFPAYFRDNATQHSTNASRLFEFLNAEELVITGLKEFNACYLNLNTEIERVLLPDVETLFAGPHGTVTAPSNALNNNFEIYIKEFILPKLTSIESAFPTTQSGLCSFKSPTLTKFSAPMLTTIGYVETFNFMPMLETLELGENFNSSISLKYAHNLSKESILDLFNKLKVLTAEEIAAGRTVTLPINGYNTIANFTEEELAIATDKGWVVK